MGKANVSRRWFVGALGGSVLAAPLTAAASPRGVATNDRVGGEVPFLRLLTPLAPGARLARWTLVAIEAPAQGAVALVLSAGDDHRFRLEILARDRSPLAARPPAETEHFAIFVRNGGDGWSPTIEEQGIAAMAVATLIRRNEAPGDAAGFLTHEERIARHAGALLSKVEGER